MLKTGLRATISVLPLLGALVVAPQSASAAPQVVAMYEDANYQGDLYV